MCLKKIFLINKKENIIIEKNNKEEKIISNMLVILDNGHGINTPGKCSPIYNGKQLLEYDFNRKVVNRIAEKCDAEDIKYIILVPEIEDISLSERCKRANKISEKCFVLSIHANAGGGTGWEIWTSKGQTNSDKIANIFYEEACKEFGNEWRMRSDTADGDYDKEENFTILYNTRCPAVLTENFFMDNEKDCLFILSDEGIERIAEMHFKAIKRIINENIF